MQYHVTVSIGTKDCQAAIRLHANCLVACVIKHKLGLHQKPGKPHLAKSHRIKGAIVQIIFLTKKHETMLCKDVLHKERDRYLLVYEKMFCTKRHRVLLVYMTVILLHMQLQIKFANQ